MRLAVYTDYAYHRVDGEIYAERAFAIFLAGLREHFSELLLIGRLGAGGEQARYPVGPGVELLALPFYPSLARMHEATSALVRSLALFWRSLPGVDCVWLLGPHPLAIAFACLAVLRGKRVVLGVRQDMPAYVRSRHPRRPVLWLVAAFLESVFRLLGALVPVVAVGPELARHYRRSRALMEVTVTLVSESEVVSPDDAAARSYDGELRLLSVGRLEEEKNPLLLADVLALLNRDRPRWRLVVCGEGELRGDLESRLAELGQADRAELLGYVSFGDELTRLYRSAHVLLHTSWTEGLPAVLFEAFAAGLPVVAADVGGIAEAVGDAAILVPPGDAAAAAQGARAVVERPSQRARLRSSGHRQARARTIESETRRLAAFLRGA